MKTGLERILHTTLKILKINGQHIERYNTLKINVQTIGYKIKVQALKYTC